MKQMFPHRLSEQTSCSVEQRQKLPASVEEHGCKDCMLLSFLTPYISPVLPPGTQSGGRAVPSLRAQTIYPITNDDNDDDD